MWRLCALLGLLVHSSAQALPAPWGTGESAGEDLVVSLVTFGPGSEIISWWGHSALVVEDRRLGQARLYNYGMFSFDDRTLVRFALGRLTFWVGEAPVMQTLHYYRAEDRDVRVQELNLLPDERTVIARALADNVLPENREYLYHHYDDNCSTRPRDIIDRATSGQLKEGQQGPGRMSLRDHTRRHTAVSPPMSLLLDYLMNSEIDRLVRRWDEAFLPVELERQVQAQTFVNSAGQAVPLVKRQWTFHRSSRAPAPEAAPAYGPWLLAFGLVGGAGFLALGRSASRLRSARVALGLSNVIVGLVLGLPGLVLFLMWTITEHTVTWRNENLLLANPLMLVGLVAGVGVMRDAGFARGLLRWVWALLAGTGLLGLGLKVLPGFRQDNWRLIALILPLSLGMALAFELDRRARRR